MILWCGGAGERESDVPEYLVDDRCIDDERDDPHRAAAPGAEQRILQPDQADQPGPADTPLLAIPALIRVVAAAGRAVGHLACGLRHGAKTRGV